MEVDLMYVFIATVGFGLIAIILLGVLLNKSKQMNSSISEQNSKEYNDLVKVVNDLSTSTNLRFNEIIDGQKAGKEFNIAFQELIENSFKKSSSNSEKQYDELTQKNISNSELTKQLLSTTGDNISQAINAVTESQANIHAESKHIFTELKAQLAEGFKEQRTGSDKHFTELQLEQNNNDSLTQKQLSKVHDKLSEKLDITNDNFEKELKTQAFTTKQDRTSAFEQLSNLVQTLRVGNLTELTNNIAKQKNLTISTADFEKHLGDCKVVQMTDKHTGQVTRFNYEKGIKRSSDTLAGDTLKYQMFFDNEGKVSKGIEFNDNGDISFEYEYDKAGEIGKRNEYIYSDKAEAPKKIEKVY
jgi:hypothetical protein